MASKEVSVSGWSLGSYWAPIISPSGSSGSNLMLASVRFLIFAKHLKVKKLLLSLIFIASAIVSPFQGLVMVSSSKGIAQGVRGNSEGV